MYRFAKAISLCLPLALGSSAGPLAAQTRDTVALPPAMEYNLLKKSRFVAGGLEYVFPIVGHAYAGNWKRGVAPAAVAVVGAGIMVSVVAAHGRYYYSDDPGGLFWVGAGLLIGGRVWGVVSATHAADAYNRRLKERLQITPQPDGSVGIRLDLSLDEARAR